jgi:hypothetical protein
MLTLREVAAVTRLGVWRVRQMRREGTGPACKKIGKTYRVTELDLANWMQQTQSVTTPAEATR